MFQFIEKSQFLIWVIALVASFIFGLVRLLFEKNIIYFARQLIPGEQKSGRKPTQRSKAAWIIFISIGLIALISTAIANSLSINSSPEVSKEFLVQANLGWQNSGVSVSPNDTVTIEHVSGTWSYWISEYDSHGPQGNPQRYICADFLPSSRCDEPLPQAPSGALIGKIGNSLPFYIGSSTTMISDSAGQLFLRINDGNDSSNLSDNIGSIVVTILIRSDN